MFTLEQIDRIHHTLGNADSLVEYLRALRAIGVTHYDSFISDGHSEYFSGNGEMLVSEPTHRTLIVSSSVDIQSLLSAIRRHSRGETDYLAMSDELAESGVRKWTFDTETLSMTYFARDDTVMLREDLAK